MTKWVIIALWASVAGVAAMTVNDWLAVNGANEATFLRQQEDGRRWTWDILQTEVWAWRFAAGIEAEFDHPRRPAFETRGGIYPEGNELVQRYGRYRDDIFDVRAGTFDKTFGKGLTLRSYEDRDFDVYQRLDGGVADAHIAFAGRQWGDVTALWGRNVRDEELQEGSDRVAGGQLTVRPVDFLYLTGSAVQAKVENVSLPEHPMEDEKLYSGGLGGGWRYFDAYAEYATRAGYNFAAADNSGGHGLYAILNGYLPRVSISGEYKQYEDLAYPYDNPPPVSYDSRMITGATGLSPGEWGYFVQATATPLRDLRIRGGYSYADDVVGEQTEKTQMVKEYFAKLRYDFPGDVDVVLEPGFEYLADVLYLGALRSGEMRRIPSAKVSWTPFDDHSFFAKVERERRMSYTVDEEFIDNRIGGGYTYSSWLGITLDYEDSTERVQETVDPGDPLAGIPPVYRMKNNWLWGELRLTWYHELFQNHVLTIGYGSRRGGWVCSSGVCKQEAPFSGLRVALESSF